jgi:hypothetical protein
MESNKHFHSLVKPLISENKTRTTTINKTTKTKREKTKTIPVSFILNVMRPITPVPNKSFRKKLSFIFIVDPLGYYAYE